MNNNKKLCIQGNLDPEILLKKEDDIIKSVDDIMKNFIKVNHVFNLGHGVIKNTPVENVKILINTVKNWKI